MADVVERLTDKLTDSEGPGTRRRRGRRPSGEDTRAALLAAALEVFGEQGFDSATVRGIATRAGVDAAMVNHWFGGKRGLFLAAIQAPFDPTALIDAAISGDPDTVAERIIRVFVTAWDTHRSRFRALMRNIAGNDSAAATMRDFVFNAVIRRVTDTIGVDRAELRTSLCASQLIGLGMARYVLDLEPLMSADIETVVAMIAPTLQRYLTADITSAG
ncbi:MAG TPA: TetR family transcriptional regulator [Pseudonocardiaceae bacterium]|nr:TetR family transcriptional regulator [Pseudonocardiaceae bacterium]